jgi:hypothetical protein
LRLDNHVNTGCKQIAKHLVDLPVELLVIFATVLDCVTLGASQKLDLTFLGGAPAHARAQKYKKKSISYMWAVLLRLMEGKCEDARNCLLCSQEAGDPR